MIRSIGAWIRKISRTSLKAVALRALLCVGVVALLVWMSNVGGVMSHIQFAYARATGLVLGLLGEQVMVSGNLVQTPEFGISVVTACTGIFLTGLFIAAVIALPARLRSTLSGIGLGVLILGVLNVVRLVSLYYIGVHWPSFLDTAHLIVWQSLFILVAVVTWLCWASSRGMERRTTEVAP